MAAMEKVSLFSFLLAIFLLITFESISAQQAGKLRNSSQKLSKADHLRGTCQTSNKPHLCTKR